MAHIAIVGSLEILKQLYPTYNLMARVGYICDGPESGSQYYLPMEHRNYMACRDIDAKPREFNHYLRRDEIAILTDQQSPRCAYCWSYNGTTTDYDNLAQMEDLKAIADKKKPR